MTTIGMSAPRGRMIQFPSSAEIRRMVLNDPGAFRTVVVCATIAFLALIGVSAWIIVSGHDLYVLSLAVLGPVVTLLTAILRRQKEQSKKLDQMITNTDPRNAP